MGNTLEEDLKPQSEAIRSPSPQIRCYAPNEGSLAGRNVRFEEPNKVIEFLRPPLPPGRPSNPIRVVSPTPPSPSRNFRENRPGSASPLPSRYLKTSSSSKSIPRSPSPCPSTRSTASSQRIFSEPDSPITPLSPWSNKPKKTGHDYVEARKKLNALKNLGWVNVHLSDEEINQYKEDMKNGLISGKTYIANIESRIKGQKIVINSELKSLMDQHKVSAPEAVSIMMYTSEAYQYITPFMRGKQDKCIKALDHVNRGRIKAGRKEITCNEIVRHIKSIASTLNKLPGFDGETIHRFIQLSKEEQQDMIDYGQEIKAFTSATSDKEFSGNFPNFTWNTKIIFSSDTQAKSIRAFSLHPEEQELLMQPEGNIKINKSSNSLKTAGAIILDADIIYR